MKMEQIKRIAVVGTGNMEHQVAVLCAGHGFETVCTGTDKELSAMIVNRINAAVKSEVHRILDTGYAIVPDIDNALVLGLGHKMGSFRLSDMTGIDTTYRIAMNIFRQTNNKASLPWPGVAERFFKGELGEKTGLGFYDYSTGKPVYIEKEEDK